MNRLWAWCVLPALAMSLGWGLRGSIGGGSLGAMIPGAMIGLVLCLLLGRESGAGVVAAMAAIGVGFGGQETYGQTVGLSLHPETFRWAMLGFAVKGAAWGLAGGACLGAALRRDFIGWRRVLLAFGLMALGCWAGWAAVNHPKLVYFSNLHDRPREELWAGLWLGGLLFLAVLRERAATRFALWGAIGGGIGFACGAALQPWGKMVWADMPLGWWKAMELTFGAVLGISYGLCAWSMRAELKGERRPPSSAAPLPAALGFAALAVALAVVAGKFLPVRFGYTLAGGALACLAWRREDLAWQTAITATFAAFSWDLMEDWKNLPPALGIGLTAAASAFVAVIVARRPRVKPMFLLLMWTAVINSFRYLTARGNPTAHLAMLGVFVALGLTITSGILRGSSSRTQQG